MLIETNDLLRETMPRSMAPVPESETPIYFNEESAQKSPIRQREYETPGTKKSLFSSNLRKPSPMGRNNS